MTTAEAAQAWAEANEALRAAHDALKAAEQAFKTADAADKEAWETLQKLSGRSVAAITATHWPPPTPGIAASNGAYTFDDGFKR